MKVSNRQGITALVLAVSSAAVLGSGSAVRATSFTISNSVDTLIEASGPFSGATRVTAEGVTSGANATFQDYGLIDFSTAGLLPVQSQASAIGNITLNLVDKAEGFGITGVVDVYVTTYTGTTSTLTYKTDAGSQPQGIGTALDTRYLVGTINYSKTLGAVYSTTLDLSNATLQSYLVSQINNGGLIRFAVADDAPTVAADFEGSAGVTGTPSLAPPSLNMNLTTSSVAATNTLFSIAAGTGSNATGTNKALSITIPRMLNTFTATQNITITNTGTDTGSYSLVGSTGSTTVAGGVGTFGVDPVPANGVSNITVGISPSTIMPGSTQPVSAGGNGPVSATVTVRNQSNAADADAVVTLTANQVVATRIVDNVGANGTPVQFGKILSGKVTAPQTVTLDTENTGTFDLSNQSLTTITLLATTTMVNKTLGSALTGTNDTVSMPAGAANVTFGDGSVTTTRNVTFTGGTVGGLYQTTGFFDGFGNFTMVNADTALGSGNTTARIYVEADVYQPALVTSAVAANTATLTNTKHTVNIASVALGDIGARSSAFVTSVAFTGQAGWTPAATLTTSTVIADAASVTAANFDPTAKWNGTYKGTLLVGLQNDQSITGAAPNDLGTSNFTLSTTVTGNSGNASVNVLAGGSFAGYSIPRGTGKNSTASLLGGTSASGNTVSAVWSDGVNTTLSDRANITKTSSDLLVVQMSYDATAVTGGTATAPTLALPNASGQYISAVLSNSNGGAGSVEVNSAYDGNLVLGHYGIDTTNHTVWAVVDAQGQFEAVQRLFGDANGDGKVDLTDLSTILNNFGSTTAFWSQGNFDGASTIDLTDLSDVLNNFGTSVPGSSVGGASPAEAVPEPASLGVLMLGMGLLLKRRR